MRSLRIALGLFVLGFAVFSQTDRGTITGTIADPAGAVVASAPIECRNVETGALYKAASSATGNYTLAQLPTGTYEMSVTVAGFKKYIRQNILLPVAQTLRIDVALEVGATTDSVTVTEASPLLKTESGELSHNVNTERLDNLPVLGIGASAGSAGIRNPYAVLQLLPGSNYLPDNNIRVNGMPGNTQALRIEGQDATNGLISTQSMTQPSVDAIQEFSIQTSNYAAEFGLAGGGMFNATMRSGSNLLHGSAYEYFANEALNAGQPFTNDGSGRLLRNRVRRNDYGFTLGGPVYLPKVYNGHDKAFFFFNFEQFRETIVNNNSPITVPTLAYRGGDFRQALTNRVLCAAPCASDPLGRAILENTIYDPGTDHLAPNGQRTRDPYPNNTIPSTDFDPVAAKVQALTPLPTSSGLVNNYLTTFTNPRLTYIPSVKADYLLSSKSKVSGYWSRTSTFTPSNTALSQPISTGVPTSIVAHTIRLNFDQTLTPTLLLHLGAGLLHTVQDQPVPPFDPVQEIGLRGTYSQLFPSFQSLSGAQGGGPAMGIGAQSHLLNTKPTGNISLTWVRNNHTYKAGGEMTVEGYPNFTQSYTNGWLIFDPIESGLPALNGVSLSGGSVGYSYASFLLGAVDNGYTGVPTKTRVGSHSLSGFVQDSWKVTRKLTLDYGLRYDFTTYLKEQYGRIAEFSPSTPNPNAGGRLGAVAFEGYGGGRCNCELAHNYPFAFGPRIGVAYQIIPKTVLRVGVGVSYYKTDDNNFLSLSTGSLYRFFAPSYGDPSFFLRNGLPYKITWPNFDPGQFTQPGLISTPPQQFDPQAGRPARILQWSIGLQREIARDLVVEATYVGNRGVWWNASVLISPNALGQQTLSAVGLSLNNPADLTLLAAPLSSSLAISRGFGGLPYPGFPANQTVAQAIRPFPMFSSLTNFHYSPLGDTWYDALQAKATKRLSHGLDFSSSFTWGKQLKLGPDDDRGITSLTNDIFNRPQNKHLSSFDQPFLFVVSGDYTTPKLNVNHGLPGKALSAAARDWQVGAVMRYGSGMPIPAPFAQNGLSAILFRSTGPTSTSSAILMSRVPGVPLFTQDLNCHCFDPNKTFVLNPAAWVNPPAGQFGTAAGYYDDYRYQRRPLENMSLARTFRFRAEGKMSLQVRAEFTNIFNRAEPNNPTAVNALATQIKNATGQTSAGFGYVNNATTASSPRQGTLVARFQF
jgi:hypothetical protein